MFTFLKREEHRKALLKAAISGNSKFFLGADSATHFASDKESSCGCAGVFNDFYYLSILRQLFDNKKNYQHFKRLQVSMALNIMA